MAEPEWKRKAREKKEAEEARKKEEEAKKMEKRACHATVRTRLYPMRKKDL